MSAQERRMDRSAVDTRRASNTSISSSSFPSPYGEGSGEGPRREARRGASTGPRSAAGKERSRWNALTHGLYARTLTAAAQALGEDAAQFGALREALLKEYAPDDLQEERLVERMALLIWRQDRLVAYAQQELANQLSTRCDVGEALLRSERFASAEARLDRAISRLHRDLLFLARYRERAREEDARRQSKRTVEERLALLELEADRFLDQAPAEEDEPYQADSAASPAVVAKESRKESAAETVVSRKDEGTDPLTAEHGSGRSLSQTAA